MVGVLVSGALGGYFVTRTSKKTPYEHLALLVDARSDWPEELASVSTIDRSIARALAQIRAVEGRSMHADATDAELAADWRVARERSRDAWLKVGLVVFFIGYLLTTFAALSGKAWLLYSAVAVLVIGVVILTFRAQISGRQFAERKKILDLMEQRLAQREKEAADLSKEYVPPELFDY